MNRRESADLDRHITGNYGEDQLREDPDAPVPTIQLSGSLFRSTAARPRHLADICASWSDDTRKRAEDFLAGSQRKIYCEDATAYAAVLALSIELMTKGFRLIPLARIVKVWET